MGKLFPNYVNKYFESIFDVLLPFGVNAVSCDEHLVWETLTTRSEFVRVF